jgi:hypothetical protein
MTGALITGFGTTVLVAGRAADLVSGAGAALTAALIGLLAAVLSSTFAFTAGLAAGLAATDFAVMGFDTFFGAVLVLAFAAGFFVAILLFGFVVILSFAFIPTPEA